MEALASGLFSNLVYERQLGKGGGGEVFLYRHRHSGKYFAVKKMANFSKGNKKYVERALESCARIYHPNILSYYGNATDSRFAYFIFEYMPGGDLMKEVIRRRETVDIEVLRKWIRQIVSALVYLRQKGIMHRDIKPDNILLTNADHSIANAKLSDFDTCRSMLAPKEERKTMIIGTHGYMAPEVQVSSTYNSQVDVWSLGCLIFELVTWKLPFTQHSKTTTEQQREGPVFPSIPVVPDDVKHFIRYCLVYDPTLRPSANDLSRHPLISHTARVPELPQPAFNELADLIERPDDEDEEEEKREEEDEDETGFGRGPEIREIKGTESTINSDVQDLQTCLQTIVDKQMEFVAIISKLSSPMEAKAACDNAKHSLIQNQKLLAAVIRTRNVMHEETEQFEELTQTLGIREEELTNLGTHLSSI